MICIRCKREIPEESTFCMYCGQQQTEHPQEQVAFNPPAYISGVDVLCTGPKKEERRNEGFLGTYYIGRWLEIRVRLRDVHNDYTASDGILFFAFMPWDRGPSRNQKIETQMDALRKEAYYFLEKEVHTTDFNWHEYSNNFGRKWKELNITLLINELVYAPSVYTESRRPYVRCFFKPTGSEWFDWNSSGEEDKVNWE